jgi:hypothetical protein
MKYFEDKWTGSKSHFLRTAKPKVKKLWENVYKHENVILQPQSPPSPAPPVDYLVNILSQVASPLAAPTRTSSRKDQYAQYLEEPVSQMPIMQYWRSKESEWPQLASIAFDFLAVPAISSECEQVFLSYAKQTTPESLRLTGRLL